MLKSFSPPISKPDVHLPLLTMSLLVSFLLGQFLAASTFALLNLMGPGLRATTGMKAILICRQPQAWGVSSKLAFGVAHGSLLCYHLPGVKFYEG